MPALPHAAEIDAWVDRRSDEIRSFLQELIRARPETDEDPTDASAAQERLVAAADGLGFDVSVGHAELDRLRDHPGYFASARGGSSRAYVAAGAPGAGGGRSLVVNGHIDVVAAGDPATWARAPFSGDFAGGMVHGRGAADAKGPLAAGLFAAACAREVSAGLQGDLTVVAATDEELGGMSTLGSLLDGITADAAVVCEPTDLAVAPAGRGVTGFRVTVEGRHAHAGAAFEGVNAISKAARIVAAIDAFEADLDRRRPNPLYRDVPVAHCFNVGVVRGGEWLGGVPERCVVEALAPVIGDEDVAEMRSLVREEIGRVAGADEWLAAHPPQLEWIAPWFEPAFTPPEHPFVQLAAGALESAAGAAPAVTPLLGGSDLRFYSRYFGIPGVHLGPGAMRLGHGPDELVPFDEVLTATRAIARLIVGWCGCTCHGPAASADG